MEITDVTEIRSSRRPGIRRRLAGAGAPPSLQAQLVLMISALLLGGVLTSLLFVGIWRHTAADGQRARAAQQVDRQQLLATRRQLATLQAERAGEQAALGKARRAAAAAQTELAQLRRRDGGVAGSLQPALQAVVGTSGSLSHDASTLESEVAALRAYLKTAAAGVAPSDFLDAQIRYLVASAESARTTAAKLGRQAQAAQTTAAKLRPSRH